MICMPIIPKPNSPKTLLVISLIVVPLIIITTTFILLQPKNPTIVNQPISDSKPISTLPKSMVSVGLTSNNSTIKPKLSTDIPVSKNQKEASNIKFSLAELATHNSSQSCYVAYQNEVFDITTFLPNHPGGQRKATSKCGQKLDSFSELHSGGSFDSPQVKAMLQERIVGVLE